MPRLCAWRAPFALALMLLVASGCGRSERRDFRVSDNSTLPPGHSESLNNLRASLDEERSAGAAAPQTRLANTTTPRGYANSTLPRGFANSTLPSGYANRTLPSGYANSTLPDGYANRTLPSGYADRTLPAGYGNSTLPGGYGNSTLPEGYASAPGRSSAMNSTLPEVTRIAAAAGLPIARYRAMQGVIDRRRRDVPAETTSIALFFWPWSAAFQPDC